ncbi:MAG TPA: glycine cleavage T C-terminal barrel domain-containing protein, partial [Ignavibacteria bacterium]|nr:glycine cleavage T C-terminal barrel domain-containing protein [Ignavibacteria bacterium]
KLTDTDLASLKYYTFAEGKVAGVDTIISRTGYTGEGMGFELYIPSDKDTSEKIWKEIFKAGEEFSIKPIGLGARDTLRLEAGYCLYGNDIDKTTNTIEAGLGWITKPKKGEFNGKSKVDSELANGSARKLVGFIVSGRLPARHGYEIYANDKKIGVVTSGSMSPCLNKNIGLGYVESAFSAPGSIIKIKVRNDLVDAEVVKIPFVGKE